MFDTFSDHLIVFHEFIVWRKEDFINGKVSDNTWLKYM